MYIRHIVTTLFISMFLTTTAGAALIPGFYPGWLKYQKKAAVRNQQIKVPLKSSATPSGNTYTDPVTGMEFVWVSGGCFDMGSNDGDSDEKPVHHVCVDGFYMGKYEVTQKQWRTIMGNNPSKFKGDNRPVEEVSWNDAQEYIKKLTQQSGKHYRLPTEAEWEYVARGGQHYKYAGSNNIGSVAWYRSNSGSCTHNVGQKQPNGYGFYDMSGNVWEWCNDWNGVNYYANSLRNNPQGPSSGSSRVNRGGGWCLYPSFVRSAYRGSNSPGNRGNGLGFRLVLFSTGR